jgi:hypothetical protein
VSVMKLLVSVLSVLVLAGTSGAASIAKQCRQECAARSDLDCGSLKKHKKQKCKAKLLHQCVKAKSTDVCQVATVTPTTLPGSSPTSTTLPGGACRTYGSEMTQTTSSGGVVMYACTFDTSTHAMTCELTGPPDPDGCIHSTETISRYDSTADFVDEVSVIPHLNLLTRIDINITREASCTDPGLTTAFSAYSYDSQRRVTQITYSSPEMRTYTAWDASGRVTTGTITGDGTLSHAESYSYDDAARSHHYVNTTSYATYGTFVWTSDYTFDENGNPFKEVLTETDGKVDTLNWTISATKTVCK